MTSREWTRGVEPKCLPSKWEKDDIVVTLECCDYPVLVGKQTEFDRRRGYSQVGLLPTACPCKCAYKFNGRPREEWPRLATALINPLSGTLNHVNWYRPGPRGCPDMIHAYDLIVLYESYYDINPEAHPEDEGEEPSIHSHQLT